MGIIRGNGDEVMEINPQQKKEIEILTMNHIAFLLNQILLAVENIAEELASGRVERELKEENLNRILREEIK